MELTKIRVKTIGYYHRDSEMKATPGRLPKNLDLACLTPIQNKEDFPNMNIEVLDSGKGELMMESLLDYISQTSCLQDEQPGFVTNKQLLVALTRTGPLAIHLFRWNGTTYLLKFNEDESVNQNFGAAFEHHCTETNDDEPTNENEPVRKAVMIAEIPRGKGVHSVLYSGQIDAVDNEVNRMHYELKVLSGGLTEHFWKTKSCMFYWQAVFGKADVLIIGSRTGKCPNDPKTTLPKEWPPFSVYQVETLKRNRIPESAAEECLKKVLMDPAPEWKPLEGEESVCYFLDLVEEYVKNNGDCYVFTRSDENPDWIVKEDEESVAEFRDVVRHYLDR